MQEMHRELVDFGIRQVDEVVHLLLSAHFELSAEVDGLGRSCLLSYCLLASFAHHSSNVVVRIMLGVSVELRYWGENLLRHRVMVLHQYLCLIGSELLLVDGHELLLIDPWRVQDMSWHQVARRLGECTLGHAWSIAHSLLLGLDTLRELLVRLVLL